MAGAKLKPLASNRPSATHDSVAAKKHAKGIVTAAMARHGPSSTVPAKKTT